eukprot:TRINITY_DN29622_c0_g1_i1.p1 TRINITY_DN29622_c0_g1~~TRINITY_DN29622_c0_g1_i1.p1  ORF type:complete len:208 (+),score=19.92 TRINITY_DN29622_c0_g1_i1:45-668(+)
MRDLGGLWVAASVLGAFLLGAASGQTCGGATAPNIDNLQCPFAPWRENGTADTRWCYECRWCPFREHTCCEKQDEITLLKNINVSGGSDWSCFITIAHFQECGKCSPESQRYTVYNVDRYLRYAPNPECLSINVCEEACGYIYKQCKGTKMLSGEPVIDPKVYKDKDAFCSYARAHPENCYNPAPHTSPSALAMLLASCAFLIVFSQ